MENNSNEQLNNVQADEVQQDVQEQQPKKSRTVERVLTAIIWMVVLIFLLFALLKAFVVSNIVVRGDSMNPNYSDGQTVWVNKVKKPKRGEVVVLYKNSVNKFLGEFARGDAAGRNGAYEKLIKRVVAVGGDKIWLEEVDETRCVLVIKTPDGKILREDGLYNTNGKKSQFYEFGKTSPDKLSQIAYLPKEIATGYTDRLMNARSEETAITIDADHYFVMGDNRFNSSDSRILGAFSAEQVYGVLTTQ